VARFITINGRSYQAKVRSTKGTCGNRLEVAMDPSQAAATILFRSSEKEAFEGSCFQTADASHSMDKAFDLIRYWQNQ
jgi:hypothetical protein